MTGPAWEYCPVRDIAVERGLVGGPFGSSLVKADYVEDGIPVIRGVNLPSDRRFNNSEFVFVSEDKYRRDLERNTAAPGDVVFTQRGTLGQVGIVPAGSYGKYVVSQSQMRLRVDEAVAIPEFVYYAFRSPAMVSEILRNAIATGVPHINLGILGGLELPVPPLEEQRRIADLLGALDDKIDVNQRIAFGSENLAVVELAARLDDAEWSTLGELASHHKEAVDPSSFGDQEVDHFSIPAFDSGHRPVRELASSIKSGKLVVQDGDVLVSRLNPRIPRVWSARTEADLPAMCSTEFLVLRPADAAVTPGLIFAAVSQPVVSRDMTQRASGTSGSHQRIKPADALAVPVPIVRNAALSRLLDDLVETASQARQEAASLAQLRDALLPKLLSGELRVRDAEETVEGVA